jgi:uncharacterized protein YjbI with pentapeptide repeats
MVVSVRQRALTAWTSLGPKSRAAAVVLGLGLASAAVVCVLKWAPEWLATGDLKGKDKAEEISRARTAVLATLAGLIAVVGAIFTGLSYRLNRAGQITERFTRAVDQLGSSERDVRLGGIYTLERIAGDSEADHPQVVEVLTAYVREHAPWPQRHPAGTSAAPRPDALGVSIEAVRALERIATGSHSGADPVGTAETPGENEGEPHTDVQAAISVLGRRNTSRDKKGAQLRLSDVDLRGVSMRAGRFEQARLRRANLDGAHLEGAHLEGAKLDDAQLVGADLGSDRELDLPSANLDGASLLRANFNRAKLEGARLRKADLQGTMLGGANLEGAILIDADLRGATLAGAALEGADFSRANLQDANIQDADYDRNSTRWPEGFEPTDHGAHPVDDASEPESAPHD